MKSSLRIIIGLIAFISSLSGAAQVHYTHYEYWEKEPHVFPQVIMFTADWCQPSKAMYATINRLALEYAGRVKFNFVDIDDEPEWAAEWSVPVLPTTYFIYESDLATGGYGWMALRSSVPYYKLKEQVEWLLAKWSLKNLPQPVKISEANDETDRISVMSAALMGDVESMAYLGDSMGEDAVPWNYMASQNGNVDAMYRLGSYLFQFEGSESRGVELIANAAEGGCMLAIETLIHAYQYGTRGVPQNHEREAYYRRLRFKFQ